jgi:NAD(P)-dependent dehydrogenase (short-subunit alcohol dehydrogenase family)
MRLSQAFLDQVCVVTGGASGIGLALAEALLENGARVLLADRDEASLAAAVVQLARHGERLATTSVDVVDAAQVAQMIEAATARFGPIDYLFNNAGIGGTLPIESATLAHWQRVIDVNLWGVIHGIQAALPAMRHRGRGHIVNTASISGLLPIPGQSLYNAAKYAVVGLSESLRLELQADGIGVSVVCPGAVVSRIWGTPILGARVERQAPAHAVPADVAARTILQGVARKQGIIVLPARELRGWLLYRCFPRLVERTLRAIARERRVAALAQTPGTH